MNKKYETFKEKESDTFYRIRALRDFGNVKTGDVGGYIENESNLSHEGDCWVFDNAEVYGNAQVFGNAQVYGNARVHGDAQVYDNARVYDNAWVYDNAEVFGYALVFGNAWIYENAQVSGYAEVYGNAWVHGDTHVSGDVSERYSTEVSEQNNETTTNTDTMTIAVQNGTIKLDDLLALIEQYKLKVHLSFN